MPDWNNGVFGLRTSFRAWRAFYGLKIQRRLDKNK